MKKTLFITGITGLVGKELLSRLNPNKYRHIYCIFRTENEFVRALSNRKNVTLIKSDIYNSSTYNKYLECSDIVIHMAALTGKANPEEYFKVNSEGTRHLLSCCKKHKIERFIYISTIAAKFSKIKGYYYAQSKQEAERYVKNSGLSYTILRPTIVIGRHSSIVQSLSMLAKAPLVPIFGDGKVKIQPIDVANLADFIIHTVDSDRFSEKTIELGGSEQISIENFIKRIHVNLSKKKFRPIHLPISIIASVLLLLERYLLFLLPFTAGQLATFTNDGVSSTSTIEEGFNQKLISIDDMLECALIPLERQHKKIDKLSDECIYLSKYLIGTEPDSYIMKKYLEGNRQTGIYKGYSFFDSLLVNLALKGNFLTKIVDSYCGIFYRKAVIRKKLLLAIALLECPYESYHLIDYPIQCSQTAIVWKCFKKSVIFSLVLLLSIPFFMPIHTVNSIWAKFGQDI